MPSASRARLIISYRSPAVNGFSPVWLYCAEPIPTMISSFDSRMRFTVARWPRWNGWNRPMKKARPVTRRPREEVVDVWAFDRQELAAVDAAAVIVRRRERGTEL